MQCIIKALSYNESISVNKTLHMPHLTTCHCVFKFTWNKGKHLIVQVVSRFLFELSNSAKTGYDPEQVFRWGSDPIEHLYHKDNFHAVDKLESFNFALNFIDWGNVPYTIAMFVAKRSVVKTGRPLKMAAELHPRSGKLIGLSNSNRTARRNQPVQEFNHGLVLSKEPLRDRDVFTVRIDKKVNKSRPLALLLLPGALAGGLRENRSLNGPAVCHYPQSSAAVITLGVLTD